MVQYFLLVLFLSIGLKANEVFSFAEEFPLVILNGEEITNAFTGGLNKPKVQWLDHDEDGDIDLFLSDIDGYLRYYENHGNSSNHNFILRKSHFQNISPAGFRWRPGHCNTKYFSLVGRLFRSSYLPEYK